jgi:hypothetical protein
MFLEVFHAKFLPIEKIISRAVQIALRVNPDAMLGVVCH